MRRSPGRPPHRIPSRPRAAGGALRPACAALVALLGAAAPGVARGADPGPRQQIEGRLMCYCGCSDLTVRVCSCGTAESIRKEIDQRLQEGASPDQVVASFVARYGEQIRSAPSKSGFELLAWTTPFALLLLAGTSLVAVIRRWRGAPAAARPPDSPTAPRGGAAGPASAEERRAQERVRRELGQDR